jgi:hypothetical protein
MEKPETTTELLIEGAKVGDQPVTIGPDGVHPAGQTVPVPIGSGADSLNQALAQSGITVKAIKFSEIEGGAAGDALEITLKHPIPGAQNVQGTFVLQMGGATSYIAFGEGGPSLPIADVPLPDGGSGGPVSAEAPLPSSSSPDSTGSASDVVPALPAGVGGEPFPLALSNGSLTLGAGTPAQLAAPLTGGAGYGAPSGSYATPGVGGTAQPVVLARDFSDTTKALFALLAVAGALLVSSSALWRFRGVSALWKG